MYKKGVFQSKYMIYVQNYLSTIGLIVLHEHHLLLVVNNTSIVMTEVAVVV